MKKEGTQRSKKWIWIVAIIVAILAIVGVILGFVLSGNDEPETASGGRPEIYWNVDRAMYADASGMSTRPVGDDGLYHITFAKDGKQMEYTFSDKRLVNAIDTSDAMGLEFDEDGNVVDMIPVINFAKEVALNAYVVKVEGNTLTLNASMTLDGMIKQVVLNDLTGVYAMTDLGEFKGAEVELSQFKPMDVVTVYANDLDEVTHIGLMSHPVESAIYWRTENVYDWGEGCTSRVPDENGDYTIEFLVNGEYAYLKCKDKDLVSKIDKVTLNIAAFGLVFDEEGYIIDTQIAQLGIRGKLACELYDVTEVNGKTFTAQKVVGSGVDVGNTYTNTYTEDTAIYNNSESYFKDRGQRVTDLMIGDRIIVYENTVGEIAQIIIWKRQAPGPLYYNFEQKSEKREPDANGWYQIQLFNGEETKYYKTKDREMALAADQAKLIGLKVNGDVIEYVYPANLVVCNYFPDYSRYNYYVTNVTGVIVTLASSDGTVTLNKVLNANCKIYNMSGIKQEIGEPTTLLAGDKLICFSNGAGELVYCYVQNRKVDAGVYYSYDRQYSFETGKSTRKPDANGWYVFKMAHEGKQVTLKTKSLALVEKIDKDHFPAFALDVDKNGVILDVYPGAAATGGSRTGVNWFFQGHTEDGRMRFLSEDGLEYFLTPSEEMKTYNVASVGFEKFIGEASTLQKGDQIVALTDNKNQVVYMFIKGRDAYLPLYILVERKYDYDKKETTREPDKDGWYYIELAVDGKVKTFKTKDKDIMSKVDSQWGPFAIYERNGVILNTIAPFNVDGIDALGPDHYTVTKINGNKVTVEKDGDVKTMTLGSNCKIYDTSPTAEQFGMYTKLRVNDVIVAYNDADGYSNYVLVKSRYFPREKGNTGYCEHCGKVVKWESWGGASGLTNMSGHYYLASNINRGGAQTILNDENKMHDLVLDLNGKSISYGGRAFLLVNGHKLSIVDSVGGGTVIARGTDSGAGGIIYVASATVNIYGGTFEMPAGNWNPVGGGIYAVSANLNISNATINCKGLQKGLGAIAQTSGNLKLNNVTVKGAPVIVKGGVNTTFAGKINIEKLELAKGAKIDISAMSKSSKICVDARGVFTQDLSNPKAYLKAFTTDLEDGKIVVEGKALACYGKEPDYTKVYEAAKKMDFSNPDKLPTTCPYCDRTVTWEPLPKTGKDRAILAMGKHYYVPEGGLSNKAHYAIDGDVCIHLNNQTITATKSNVLTVLRGTTLNIMGDGTMKGSGYTNDHTGGAILNYGILNLCGGTITNTSKATLPVIVNRQIPNTTNIPDLNIYDGTVKSDAISVKMLIGNAVLYDGAKVTGIIDTLSGSNVTVKSSKLETLKVVKGAKVTLSGKPVISALRIEQGEIVTIGKLTSGAKITVRAKGVFTNNLSNAASYKKYFTAEKEGAIIRVEGKALYCQAPEPNHAAIVEAAKNMTFPTDGSDHWALCPYCDEEVMWTGIKALSKDSDRLIGSPQESSKHYYLAKNVTSNVGLYAYNGSVCLHLNGKTLSTGAEYALTGQGSNQFTIMGDGKVKATASNGTTFSVNYGQFNVYGGTYTSAGANVVNAPRNTDVFNLYGGTIGSSSSYAVKLNNGATFNMHGGKVTGNAIYSASDSADVNTITITNGTISGNGIVVKNGILNLQGGTISTVNCGAKTTEVNLSGSIKIAVLDLTKSLVPATVGELKQGAEIGVKAKGVFTNKLADPEATKQFFSAVEEGAEILVDGRVLSYKAPEKDFEAVITAADAMTFPEDGSDYVAECPHCGQSVTWTAIKADTNRLIGSAEEESKHYYLAEDMNRAEDLFVWNGAACLHLNGKTLNCAASNVFTGKLGHEFTVMGNGTVNGTAADATVFMGNTGTFNVYGGTYTSAGSYVYRGTNATDVFNFYGGTLGNSTKYSALVSRGAHFNMYGGTVSGQSIAVEATGSVDSYIAIKGGNVNCSIDMSIGQLEVYGGNIDKVTCGIRVSKLVLSGEPVIGELDLNNASVVAQADGLTGSANIGISTNGVFTTTLENAAATKTYFHPVDSKMEILAVYGALYCKPIADPNGPTSDNTNNNEVAQDAAAMTFPEDGSDYTAECPYCGETVTWTALTKDTASRLGDPNEAVKHYYLAENISRTDTLAARLSSVCLHLNGKRLSSSADTTLMGRVGKVLTIMGDGSVYNETKMTVRANYGTINVFGGTYASGGSYVFNSIRNTDVINFYAGTIEGSKLYAAYSGNGAKFNLYGGIVDGQEIISDDVSEIDNVVTIKGGIVAGDGVLHEYGTLDIQGGEINKIVSGEFATTLKLSGNPEIERLDLKQTELLVTVGQLTTGANVGIRTSGVFTKDMADPAAMQPFFHCYEEGGSIVVEGSALACIPPEPDYEALCAQMAAMTFPVNGTNTVQYCPHCEKDVTWKPMYSSTGRLIGSLPTAEHFYLAEDIVRNENFFVWNGAICVNLNGHSLTSSKDSAFTGKEGHPITIMGNGTVTCNAADATTFSVNYGTVNIYGGTYTAAGNNVFSSVRATDVVNFYGGTIGSSATNSVSITGGGSFNMYGGSITGKRIFATDGNIMIRKGTIAGDGIVINKGKLNLRGGNVNKITCGANVSDIQISGAPVVGTLDMTATTTKAAIGTLETGASIGINANGVFTTDFETAAAAQAAMDFFKTVDAVAEIKVVDKALACEGGMVASDHQSVIDAAKEMKDSGKFKHYTETETAPDVTGVACPICGTSQTWKPLTAGGNINGGGNKHYYIARETLDIGSNGLYGNHGSFSVHVFLNDSNIVADGTYSGYIVKSYGKFAMFGDGTMTLTGTEGAMLKAHMAGTIDIYGGTYTTTTAPYVAQATSADGNINLYGGTLNGGAMQTVCVEKGNFNVYGGTITGNDTSIIGTGSSKTDGYVNIYGGTVNGDIDVENGNLKLQAGTMGDVNIKSEANAVEIYGNPKIGLLTVAEGLKVNVRTLIEGADITVRANGVFTEDFKSVDAATAALAYFKKADETATLKVEGLALSCTGGGALPEEDPEYVKIANAANALTFTGTGSMTATCPVCKESVSWSALSANASGVINGGGATIKHFYVPEGGITANAVKNGDGSRSSHIHLNGQTVTANGTSNESYAFGAVGNFVLMGNGTVKQEGSGYSLYSYGGTIDVYGGNYTSKGDQTIHGWSDSTVINVFLGTVDSVSAAKGTLNIYRAEVGKVTAKATTTAIKLADTAKIDLLDLTDATVKVDATGLKEGASVKVGGANGVFTTEFADADAATAALAFFQKADNNATLKVEGKALSYSGVPVEEDPEYVKIAEAANAMTFPTDGSSSTQICPVCGTSKTWNALSSTGNFNAGGTSVKHFYISQSEWNIGNSGLYMGSNSQISHIHLNGATITGKGTSEDSYVFRAAGQYTIMGNGTVKQEGQGFALYSNGGTYDIYGGTYISAGEKTVNAWDANTVFNLYGGSFDSVSAAKGTVNIYRATVGNVKVASTLNAMALADKANITLLDLTEATIKIDATNMRNGASVKVGGANGVFTTEFADADAATAALAFFQKADNNATLKVEGKALSYSGVPVEEDPEYVKIAEAANALTFTGTGSQSAECPVCKATVSWSALGTNASGVINGGGASVKHFYVPEGGITASTIKNGDSSRSSHIHLNGQTVTANGTADDSYVFGSLGNIVLMGEGTVKQEGKGSIIYGYSGDIDIYGGNYIATQDASCVVNAYNASGAVNVYGGTFGGSADKAFIVNKATAVVNVYAGTISGDFAVTSGTVSLFNTPVIGTLDMTGGTAKVIVGTLKDGASVGVKANGVFTADFADETAATEAKEFFTYADTSKTVVVEGKALSVENSAWMQKVALAAEMKASGKFSHYTAEETAPSVTNVVCPVCGTSKTWTPLTAGGNINGGGTKHYYIARQTLDVGANGMYGANTSGKVHLYLNDSTITGTATSDTGFIFRSYGEFAVFGDGNVVQQGTTGSVIRAFASGSVDIYGGTYATTTAPYAVRLHGADTASINFYNGTITGGTAQTVYLDKHANGSNKTFNMYGGTVSGCDTSFTLAGSGNASVINIMGGTVSGKIAAEAGTVSVSGGKLAGLHATAGTINLSGNARINDLTLTNVKANVSDLKVGASFVVNADGVFTADFADANAAKAAQASFMAADSDMEITVVDKALSCTAIPAA